MYVQGRPLRVCLHARKRKHKQLHKKVSQALPQHVLPGCVDSPGRSKQRSPRTNVLATPCLVTAGNLHYCRQRTTMEARVIEVVDEWMHGLPLRCAVQGVQGQLLGVQGAAAWSSAHPRAAACFVRQLPLES